MAEDSNQALCAKPSHQLGIIFWNPQSETEKKGNFVSGVSSVSAVSGVSSNFRAYGKIPAQEAQPSFVVTLSSIAGPNNSSISNIRGISL